MFHNYWRIFRQCEQFPDAWPVFRQEGRHFDWKGVVMALSKVVPFHRNGETVGDRRNAIHFYTFPIISYNLSVKLMYWNWVRVSGPFSKNINKREG